MALSIQTQPMKINWNVTDAKQEIKQNHRMYEVTSTKAKLELQTTHPKVSISQKEQFAEAGLKDVTAFMNANTSHAKQALSEGIDNIVSQGNQLAAIENPGDPLPDIAIYNAYTKWNQKEFNIGFVPSPTNRPNIQLNRGEIKTNYVKGEVNNRRMGEKSVEISATAPKIDYFVKQYNSISIQHQRDGGFEAKV